jgi:hypothetical protein
MMQREPASLFSSTTIWFMLQLYNGSNPTRILFSEDQMNLTLRLGGPFGGVVSGRAFTMVVSNDHQPALCTVVQHLLVLVPAFSRFARDDIDFG